MKWLLVCVPIFVGYFTLRFGMISRGNAREYIQFIGGLLLAISLVASFFIIGWVKGLINIGIFWFVITPIVETIITRIEGHTNAQYAEIYKRVVSKFNSSPKEAKQRIDEGIGTAEGQEKQLIEKADELVPVCRVVLGILEHGITRKYPELMVAKNIKWFTMYGTVACVVCACIRIFNEVPRDLRVPVELRVQQKLKDWYDPATLEYESATSFIKNRILNAERKSRYEFVFQLAAQWFIMRLTERYDSLESDAFMMTVADDIAAIFRDETAGYWLINEDTKSEQDT